MPHRDELAEAVKDDLLTDLGRKGYRSETGSGLPQDSSNVHCNKALVDSIKTEILADIEAEQEMREQQREMAERRNISRAGSYGGVRMTAGEREYVKQEILRELRLELEDNYPGNYYRGNAINRAVVDNIRNELLDEIESRFARNGLPARGQSRLAERTVDRMIDQQYRTVNNISGDIRRELEAIRDVEKRISSITDPQVRETVRTIVQEARQDGVSLDQVINRLNDNTSWGSRVGGWFNSSQGRGFLWGVGATVAATMLFPITRNGLRTIGFKMMEGAMNLADQANSALGRAKEGFEDMIAEANFHNLQDEEQEFDEADAGEKPENPSDSDTLH